MERFPRFVVRFFSTIRNDVRMVFERVIFRRLDSLNEQYEKLWNLNQYLLPAAAEEERVHTSLYSDLYDVMGDAVTEWQEIAKNITHIFQETDAYVQQCSLPELCMEAAKVAVKRSRLDESVKFIQQLKQVIDVCTEAHEQIERIPMGIQQGLASLKKDIKRCLLEHIDVVESVKGQRIEGHLRRLAVILNEREVLASRVEEIMPRTITKKEKEELSGVHIWLLTADEDIEGASQAFRAVNQTISGLSEMEKQVQFWYSIYGLVRSNEVIEGLAVQDLEKRMVALKELWQGYEGEFKEFNEAGFEGRKDRLQFLVDEVERFDQDVNLVKTCRSDVEAHLTRISEMGEISNWVNKVLEISPFAIDYAHIEEAVTQYEKALIGWDNPRPYPDVQAFVEHTKRMEDEVQQFGDVFATVKENYRHVKNIDTFYSALKEGQLKQQSTAALYLYEYVNDHTDVELVEWETFERELEAVDGLLKDNPVAYARRHDPVPADEIKMLHKEVDRFKIEWQQSLKSIQSYYSRIRGVLQQEVWRMGNAWNEFIASIQTPDGKDVVFPYHVIPLPEPKDKVATMLNQGLHHSVVTELRDADLVACHRALYLLSKERKQAEEQAQSIFVKRRSIHANLDQCGVALREMETFNVKPNTTRAQHIREYEQRVYQYTELLYPGDTYQALWDSLGQLENATRKDAVEFEAYCEDMRRQYEELESLLGELTALVSKVEKSILAKSIRHLDQQTKDDVGARIQQIRNDEKHLDGHEKVEYNSAKNMLEQHINDLKAELRLSTQIRNASRPAPKSTWNVSTE